LEPGAVIASGATDVAVGGNHSCARLSSGEVQCWGANDVGQLGRGLAGTPPVTEIPAPIVGSGYLDVAVAQYASCGRTATGVSCWGYGQQGVIAGQPAAASYPTPIAFAGSFTALAEGYGPRIVALSGTDAISWGTDQSGVMARNPRGPAGRVDSTPSAMLPLAGPAALSVLSLSHSLANNGTYGLGGHACAIETSTRNVTCWGGNTRSQCGSTLPSPLRDAVLVAPL
jgi:alpha-tubulin suppressor-like RCC1 family protein